VLLTVIIPTHSPHAGRLARTLAGLHVQTLPAADWELVLVDNASTPAITLADLPASRPASLRIVHEPQLGLAHARRRGFIEARGEYLVLVDDDNVLARDYLSQVVTLFARHPKLGAFGGRSRPEFETPPALWQHEFFNLLALRDLGPTAETAGLRPPGISRDTYPLCSPIGAGMALRRSAVQSWLDAADPAALTDRRGGELTSGGDNDIVMHALRAGWEVGYFPELELTHLIPASRLDPVYLARLNRGIQKSWMQVLTKHGLNDWPPIPAWTVPLRSLKAWFTHRAWSSAAAHIRWHGACGHFAGRTVQ
jgi:glycosyltransferase involved in cell wall biosynthesis